MDSENLKCNFSSLKLLYRKKSKNILNSNMIIVLHFDGLLGMYEKPFFNSFNFTIDNNGKTIL